MDRLAVDRMMKPAAALSQPAHYVPPGTTLPGHTDTLKLIGSSLLFAKPGDTEAAYAELANLTVAKQQSRPFQEYFDRPLSSAEIVWLQREQDRVRQRSALLGELLRQFPPTTKMKSAATDHTIPIEDNAAMAAVWDEIEHIRYSGGARSN